MSEDMPSPKDEIARIYRVANQLTTAHAALHERQAHRGTALDVLGIVTSILLVTFALVDLGDVAPEWFPVAPIILVALLSVINACIVPLSARLDYATSAQRHDQARKLIMGLRLRIRQSGDETSLTEAAASELIKEWQSISELLPDIPEAQFNRLKAAHLRKVAISKLLSKSPGALWIVAWARVTIAQSLQALREKP